MDSIKNIYKQKYKKIKEEKKRIIKLYWNIIELYNYNSLPFETNYNFYIVYYSNTISLESIDKLTNIMPNIFSYAVRQDIGLMLKPKFKNIWNDDINKNRLITFKLTIEKPKLNYYIEHDIDIFKKKVDGYVNYRSRIKQWVEQVNINDFISNFDNIKIFSKIFI